MQDVKIRKGPWLEEEDEQLIAAVNALGERRWDALAKASGLRRSGKSCRLRWMNYLQPNLKRGHITAEEERVIVELHEKWGNRWSKIARRLPGRTDNEIKNYWRSYLKRKPQSVEKKECLGDTINSSCNTSSTSTLSLINGECLSSSNSDHVGTILDSSDALEELLNLTPSAYYETSLTPDLNYKMELNDELWTFDIYNPEGEEWISDNYCCGISVWDFPSWDGE